MYVDVQSPQDRLSDLLHEVRCCSHDIDRRARTLTGSDDGFYRRTIHALLQNLLRSATTREQVVGYACAAELGFKLDLPAELAGRVGDNDSFAVRVLFWTVHRRMGDGTRLSRMFDAS